ncbi:MAG: sensor domain-containing diguanylate cyclase, partial [Ketobacter sp.]
DRSQVLMHGVYYGIMFVMVMYNLFIFLAMGERNYLYYVLFVCCMPLFLASLTGFGFQYLWPEATRWNDQAILVTLAMAVCFGSLFTHNFLNATALHNFYRHLGQLLAAGAVLIAMLAMLLPYNVVIRILIPYAAVTCCYGFSLGIYRWVSGGISAKYYTIAWSSLLTGGIVLALSKFNILPKNLLTDYATQIGSAIEVALLSFALAARMNQERSRRFEAQQEAIDAERRLRQTREQSLARERRATETLEWRVAGRTRELAKLNQQLEHLSDTDQLTGLYNRRYLDRVLREEYSRCARYQHPISVLILDIDHFKQFNDSYGHLIGDDCLREVARTLRRSLRGPEDIAARFGGEEFCVVLAEANTSTGVQVAEQIRRAVADLQFTVTGQQIPVTVSVGVASLVPQSADRFEALLAQADKALYEAKSLGR